MIENETKLDISCHVDITLEIHLQQCHLSQLMSNLNSVFQTKNAWKFPGGLSDPGENIGECQSQK